MGREKVFAEQDWKDILEPDNACPSELLPCSGSLPWNPYSMGTAFPRLALATLLISKGQEGKREIGAGQKRCFFHYL